METRHCLQATGNAALNAGNDSPFERKLGLLGTQPNMHSVHTMLSEKEGRGVESGCFVAMAAHAAYACKVSSDCALSEVQETHDATVLDDICWRKL